MTLNGAHPGIVRLTLVCLLLLARCATGQAPITGAPPRLYDAAVHTFEVLRSGVPIDDRATGVRHAASHTREAVLAGEASGHRDVSGGWYNAGDYGRWPNLTAIAVSYMLHLRAMQSSSAYRHRPSMSAADPRLLDETQWGLSWMLKMQDDDGGVRHKVDGATYASLSAAWGKPPELDPNVQIVAPASTSSTATFTGVMYQAAEFFALRNREQSRQFRAAADRAWSWLQKHPNVPANDPFYIDHDLAGELLWARSEHALVYRQNNDELVREFAVRAQPEVSWMDPSLLGLYSLASSPHTSLRLRVSARKVIVEQAHLLAAAAAARPFHVALGENDYWWGSAERVLHRAALFLMASSLETSPNLELAAREQMAWVLGNNAVKHSFITAYGTNPVVHPWHWIYRDYGIVLPGWAVGGPNGSSDWADPALKALQARGTPPSQSYLDLCDEAGSWASNKGEISEEAALVFVAGVLR